MAVSPPSEQMRNGNHPGLDIGYSRKASWRRCQWILTCTLTFLMRLERGSLHHPLKKESDIRISRDTFGGSITVMSAIPEWLQSFSSHGHPSRPYFITNLHRIAVWTLKVTSLRICRSVQVLQLSIKTSWHKQGDTWITAKGWHCT